MTVTAEQAATDPSGPTGAPATSAAEGMAHWSAVHENHATQETRSWRMARWTRS